jgi:serine/threonine-protein kinase
LNETEQTLITPGPGGEALRTTLPPPAELAKTLTRGDLAATRRPSLVASIGGVTAPPERYEEGHLLGEGGMGVVVKANDRDLARSVAVKRLQPRKTAPEQVDRFLREAQVTAQLEHPGVLPVHDVGIDEQGRFFYVMRLVPGDETLRRVIDRLRAGDEATHREFTGERRVRLILKLAEILAYAHSKGVVHRDVKPENIMLGQFGEVYLVDWGLAKISGISEPQSAPAQPPEGEHATRNMTREGAIIGTPLYMAPEQARGEPATPASDVYALGAILYELLSLHHYLEPPARSTIELLDRLANGKRVPAELHFDGRNGRVPRFLSFICDRALQADPAKRYRTAKEFERALEDFIEGQGPITCPVTFQLRVLSLYMRALHRHPVFFGLTTVVFPTLAVIGYGVYRLFFAN